MRYRVLLAIVICIALCIGMTAQAPPTTAPGPASPAATTAPPIDLALSNLLQQTEQLASTVNTDIGRLRVERWKTDGATKRQTEANIDSVQRNITAALPEFISAVRNLPRDVAPSFRLYRNLSALYDVLNSVAESAGAFGPRDQFEHLAADLSKLEGLRTDLGKRIEGLADAQTHELTTLRQQVQARVQKPSTKIVVDDNAHVAKPKSTRKKATEKSQNQQ